MGGTLNRVGAAQWPAAPAANRVIEYRLAGRLVSREMHADVVAAKRQGVRVLLTTPGGSAMDETHDEVCGNCGGLGTLYLQSLVAGPFRDPPTHGPDEHVGVHNGGWWKMTLRGYPCPVCRRSLL